MKLEGNRIIVEDIDFMMVRYLPHHTEKKLFTILIVMIKQLEYYILKNAILKEERKIWEYKP
jgi:hypothetical protein